jgi:hypothetical protein
VLLEILAAVTAAFAMAGFALLARMLTRQRLPTWIVPAAAGLGMIGYAIWSEYSWYPRSVAALPPGVAVLRAEASPSGLRPWTLVAPVTLRFVALDLRAGTQHPANAGLRMVPVYAFVRWQPVEDRAMVFDCAGGVQVVLQKGMEITPEGALVGATWVTPEAGQDDLLTAACQGTITGG